MNRIQELIKELCPNGVEWKKLGEVCDVLRGKRLTKSQLTETGRYKVFHGGIEPIGFYNEKNRDANTVMVINVGASAGTIGFSSEEFWSSDGCFCISHSSIINNKFLYYYLCSNENTITTKVRHAGIPTLDSKIIEDLSIPLPPLPVQTEIVRILDKFVEQQEQLEKLIELRTKQYEYYREEMLTAKEGEEWTSTTLGEIGTFVRGNGLQKTDFTEDGVGCIHYGQIYTYYGMFTKTTKSFVSSELASKLKKVEPGDIVLACTSENIEDVCKCVVWEGNDSIVTGGHASIYKHKENPRFIAYFLKTKAFETQKIKYAYGAKVIDIKNDDLEKIIINLPSRAKQDQIVNAINNFESSISALTSALELSKKRYEHYRDEMLRF